MTVTPARGYHAAGLTIQTASGKSIDVIDNGDGTYTFVMPNEAVTIEAQYRDCPSLTFPDLDLEAWYHPYTDYVLAAGLFEGDADGRFVPEGSVTRAQMTMVLWNHEGRPSASTSGLFTDVPTEAWFATAVRWAASSGIVAGYGDGTFGPDDLITREQMAAMLFRYEQNINTNTRGNADTTPYELPFQDGDRVSDWALEAVKWCSRNEIIEGRENNVFDPAGNAMRDELAAIMTRYLQWRMNPSQ